MRIAQVTEFYPPWSGGIGEHVANLSRELISQGHEVRILTGRHRVSGRAAPVDPELERCTIRLGPNISFPYNGGMASVTYAPGLPQRLDAVLARESFDIVHIQIPMTPILRLLALDRSGAIYVGTFHSYHPTERMLRWWRWALQPRLPRLQLAIAVSPAARAAFHRYFDHPYEIVPNGIDLQRFVPNGHRPPPDGEQSLLFVGQLVPKKGLHVLLAAFEELLEEYPRLRLKVVGDGPLEGTARRQLGPRSRARVEFLGAQHGDRLVELYRTCDVFCAPSVGHESFGITLLEAMAAGKPIVAAEIPGFTDVVRDGVEAVMYASQDPRALRDALRRVVSDGAMRRDLVVAARKRVVEYGWPRVATTVVGHYERLLRSRC